MNRLAGFPREFRIGLYSVGVVLLLYGSCIFGPKDKANGPPSFSVDSTQMTAAVLPGTEYRDTLRATDADGDQLGFAFADSAEGMILTDSIIRWTPSASQKGPNHICVEVRDGKGGVDKICWMVDVCDLIFDLVTDSTAFRERKRHTSLAFENKLWVIGGSNIYVEHDMPWFSTDGATWTGTASLGDKIWVWDHAAFVFDSSLWLISGVYGNCWVGYTDDGYNWTSASAHPDSFADGWIKEAVVFDSRIWAVMRPDSNPNVSEVWSSLDGTNWTIATDSAEFGPRWEFGFLAYNQKLWVIAGDGYLSDVWYSTDGAVWKVATDSAAFGGREGHACVVFDGCMWLIGGYESGKGSQNDLWYSYDGAIWERGVYSAAFSRRQGHAAAVFNDKMWVISGQAAGDVQARDVWRSR